MASIEAVRGAELDLLPARLRNRAVMQIAIQQTLALFERTLPSMRYVLAAIVIPPLDPEDAWRVNALERWALPLARAVESARLTNVRLLLEWKANVHGQMPLGTHIGTLLEHAAASTAPSERVSQVFRLLLDAKANEAGSAMYLAGKGGHGEAIRQMVQAGLNINHQDNDGVTALHGAVHSWNLSLTQQLLAARADVRLADKAGATALHYWADPGDTYKKAPEPLLRILMDHKADLHSVRQSDDGSSETPLAAAVVRCANSKEGRSMEHLQVVNLLIQARANPALPDQLLDDCSDRVDGRANKHDPRWRLKKAAQKERWAQIQALLAAPPSIAPQPPPTTVLTLPPVSPDPGDSKANSN
jgi:hypothetical protein